MVFELKLFFSSEIHCISIHGLRRQNEMQTKFRTNYISDMLVIRGFVASLETISAENIST